MQFLEILQILLHEILAQHVKKQCYDDDGDVDICIDINVQIARQNKKRGRRSFKHEEEQRNERTSP